jgi:hypothetical protein
VIRRAERYSELHGTNVSQLVSNFLSSLPIEGGDSPLQLSPAVTRLLGVTSGKGGVKQYHRYLEQKYRR